MRAVVQRTCEAQVIIDNEIIAQTSDGFTVLLGIACDDTIDDVKYMVDKIINLRVFEDNNGKMNLSLKDVCGELMVVSQFTLYGDCRKGRRPSFIVAARPEEAKVLYEKFIELCRNEGIIVKNGIFQATMSVKLTNNGPVTILLDSDKLF